MHGTGKLLLVLALSACVYGEDSQNPPRRGYGGGAQDWGWISIHGGSYMFYWLHYTTANVQNYQDRPLVVWLQGGPGASSTGFGNFAEIGPIDLDNNEREHAWTKYVNVLFVDSPLGTGYSFVEDIGHIPTGGDSVGWNMLYFMREFYKRYPAMQNTTLYLFGESYGGKMAVDIAMLLHKGIPPSIPPVTNLAGIALIDSWISPVESVLGWPPLLLNTGFISEVAYKTLSDDAEYIKKCVNEGRYLEALIKRQELETNVQIATGGINIDNIMSPVSPYQQEDDSGTVFGCLSDLKMKVFQLMDGPVRKALGIPSEIPYKPLSTAVFNALKYDNMKSVVDKVAYLLDVAKIKVAVVNGQLDLESDVYGTVHWLNTMNWTGAGQWLYRGMHRMVFNNTIEGYYSLSYKNLSLHKIIRAGRMVPRDKPEAGVRVLSNVLYK